MKKSFNTSYITLVITLICLIISSFNAQAQQTSNLILAKQEQTTGTIMVGATHTASITYYLFYVHPKKLINITHVWVEGNFYKVKTKDIPQKKFDVLVYNGMAMDTIHVVPQTTKMVTQFILLHTLHPNFKKQTTSRLKKIVHKKIVKAITATNAKALIAFKNKPAYTIISTTRLKIIPSNVTQ